MWDLETMQKMNAPKPTQGRVSSDGRVCTDYHSRPARKRFYLDFSNVFPGSGKAFVVDSIPMQGHGSFGPLVTHDAERLCDLLNTLTMV